VLGVSATARTPDTAGAARSPHPAGYLSAPAWLRGVPHHELTTLLASLVLSTRPLERASPTEGYHSWH
jgi:hypothetical protein